MEKIDFVVAWVDGSDINWQKEMNSYVPEEMKRRKDSAGQDRFADNGLFRYFFRGIEVFTPWVNKVFFITYGHIPEWLNTSHEKIEIVKHTDFIPTEYLPTFNFVPIALNLHRIESLSENFVLFNDDMYIVSECAPEVFFKKKLPRDMAVMDTIPAVTSEMYYYMLFNATTILNGRFNKKSVICNNFFKWFSFKYGKQIAKNILLFPFALFPGIYGTHFPMSYLKSEFVKVWNENYEALHVSSQNKYRYYTDVTEEIVQYYQLAEGKFLPINKLKLGRYCSMKSKDLPKIITSGKYKYLCINDGCIDTNNEKNITDAFERLFPNKSSFEV